jgi:hypothetical protein
MVRLAAAVERRQVSHRSRAARSRGLGRLLAPYVHLEDHGRRHGAVGLLGAGLRGVGQADDEERQQRRAGDPRPGEQCVARGAGRGHGWPALQAGEDAGAVGAVEAGEVGRLLVLIQRKPLPRGPSHDPGTGRRALKDPPPAGKLHSPTPSGRRAPADHEQAICHVIGNTYRSFVKTVSSLALRARIGRTVVGPPPAPVASPPSAAGVARVCQSKAAADAISFHGTSQCKARTSRAH